MYCVKGWGNLKRRMNIWLLCVFLLFSNTGCKKTTSTNETTKEENIVSRMDESDKKGVNNSDSDDATIDDAVMLDMEEMSEQTVTNATTQTETSKTPQTPASQGNSKNNSNNNTTSKHTHTWTAQTKTVTHEATGHYETKVVEEVSAWRTFCNKCGEDITDLGAEGITIHSAILCESGYHNAYVVVETKTEQVWVEDTPAYTESVLTGYQCVCGAIK